MNDDLPFGADPRDAAFRDSTVTHLSRLRQIDRQSYKTHLLLERANVDREWAARKRQQENQDRRADRFIANAGVDDDDSMFDAATRERLRALRRTDVMAWAVAFGEARAAAAAAAETAKAQ